jgi:predicted lipoprotein with Yx(FWY)xxD motif
LSVLLLIILLFALGTHGCSRHQSRRSLLLFHLAAAVAAAAAAAAVAAAAAAASKAKAVLASHENLALEFFKSCSNPPGTYISVPWCWLL